MVKGVMVIIQVGVVIILVKVVTLSTLMWGGCGGHIIKVVMVAVNAHCHPSGCVVNAGGGSSRGCDGWVIEIIVIVEIEVVAIIAIWWSMPGVVAVEDGLSEDEGLSENSEVIYHFATPKVTTTMHQPTTNAGNNTTTTTTTLTDSHNDHDPTTTSHKTTVMIASTTVLPPPPP
ncbi:hypothetical protein V8B97DRAFT_1916206 [Scleroderma yunnanense]